MAKYALLEPDIGGEERKFMKKKIKYGHEPLGSVRVIKDFLPSPDELSFKEEGVKVTMTLSKSSIEFFKRTARKRHAPYQKMIRTLLDSYSSYYRSF
jgi:hypothetical protein